MQAVWRHARVEMIHQAFSKEKSRKPLKKDFRDFWETEKEGFEDPYNTRNPLYRKESRALPPRSVLKFVLKMEEGGVPPSKDRK